MYLEKKKNAIINIVQSGGRLPSEYQEVEYIERQGAPQTNLCYIKTGVISNNGTDIEITIEPNIDNLFHSTAGVNYSVACKQQNSSYYTPNNILVASVSGKVTILLGIKTNGQRYVEINGNTVDSTTSYFQQEIYMFTINDNNTPVDMNGTNLSNIAVFNGKIFEAKITQSETLERHFIPCYRKADNVIGFYDLIYRQFYTKQGTGTFIKGPDV